MTSQNITTQNLVFQNFEKKFDELKKLMEENKIEVKIIYEKVAKMVETKKKAEVRKQKIYCKYCEHQCTSQQNFVTHCKSKRHLYNKLLVDRTVKASDVKNLPGPQNVQFVVA